MPRNKNELKRWARFLGTLALADYLLENEDTLRKLTGSQRVAGKQTKIINVKTKVRVVRKKAQAALPGESFGVV